MQLLGSLTRNIRAVWWLPPALKPQVLSQFTPEPGSAGTPCLFVRKGVYAAGRWMPIARLLLPPATAAASSQPTLVTGAGAPMEEQQGDLEPSAGSSKMAPAPARAQRLDPRSPMLAERNPPIRHRLNVPTLGCSSSSEGRNRQVRPRRGDWLSHAAADPLEPGSHGRELTPLVRGPGARPVALAFPLETKRMAT